MSDNSFFREVDDAVRQDQYKKLWDKYGVLILVAAACLIVGVASYKGWTYWQGRQGQKAGAEFSQALTLESPPASDTKKAEAMFDALAKSGPEGYQVLARFQIAAAAARDGKTDKAVADYDALATDSKVDSILQGLAAIQAATLRLDTADYSEMERRLKGFTGSDNPWRFSARELLGLSAYQHNDMRVAEEQFTELLGDQGTPPNLRDRANMMLALIVGNPPAVSDAKTN
jgi:hypothetical protein